MDTNYNKESNFIQKEKELFIYLNENDDNKDKSHNEFLNYSQKTSSSDLLKNDDKNKNNIIKYNNKNNLIQSLCVRTSKKLKKGILIITKSFII